MAEHRPAVVATAIALPVALAVGVVVAAVLAQRSPVLEPVALTTIDAPDATSPGCTSLLGALPEDVGGGGRAELAEPAPVGAAAWRTADAAEGVEPFVLRCGLTRPAEFDEAAPLLGVDGVQWLEIPGADAGITATTWVAVDRSVYVALTLPDGTGPAALQDVSAAITSVLPENDLDPAPIG